MKENTTVKIKVQNALGKTEHYLVSTIEDEELRKQFDCKYVVFDSNDCIVGVYNSLVNILQDYK